jgi:hypothetical protein
MTIVGKILVILNLVFALTVGGLVIFDFATRTNWRKEYEALKNEMDVARASFQVAGGTLGKFENDIKKAYQDRDTARQALIDKEEERKAQEVSAKIKLDEALLRATDADLTAQKALAEKERFNKENQGLLVVLKQRDVTIVAQQADIVKFRNAALAQESAYKAAQDRLDQALARNAELERTLAKAGPGGVGPGAAADRTARGQENPPAVYVEGKVEAIDPKDPDALQINVGSDKGLGKGHTLFVFRPDPGNPLYLGMLRIRDVTPHIAIGRLERLSTGSRTPVRPGDTVASSLTRN